MGKKRSIEHYHHRVRAPKSQTLPPSPSHSFSSSSSSDFEFTISISPRNKSSHSLCPADELFYKGQLLPLHLSPRLSMVRTLLLASSSTSSGSSASRDSTGRSSTDSHSSFNSELVLLAESCDSSRRPSSVAAEDHDISTNHHQIKTSNSSSSNSRSGNNFRYFSLPRFSSVFKREPNSKRPESGGGNAAPASSSSVKRMSSTAKEVIRKYLKKVKPLYEKISQKQSQQNQNHQQQPTTQKLGRLMMMTVPESTAARSAKPVKKTVNSFSNSFSGNLRYPRRKSSISSCPSSIRSSPSHSGVLCRPGFGNSAGKGMFQNNNNNNISLEKSTSSSMEELQSAIQGAIAHCKNSLIVHHTAQE